jgi:hypothetical protein
MGALATGSFSEGQESRQQKFPLSQRTPPTDPDRRGENSQFRGIEFQRGISSNKALRGLIEKLRVLQYLL